MHRKLHFRYILNDENVDDFTGIARDDIGSYTNIKECKLKCNKWCKNIINNEDISIDT